MIADKDLSLKAKRLVYRAVVLGVLLYGAETMTIKLAHSKKLEVFHNRCMRAILGITSSRQIMERISSVQIRKRFGLEETVEDVIAARRLRWLVHISRMEDSRLPKKFLFGRLSKCRPAHGTKMRWRDRAKKDV